MYDGALWRGHERLVLFMKTKKADIINVSLLAVLYIASDYSASAAGASSVFSSAGAASAAGAASPPFSAI